MKVLNIHGFDGNRINTNFRLLEKCSSLQVISPQLDYRNRNLEEIYSELSKLIEDNNVKLIVATSFGAFFGKRLANEYAIPCILTNPCFRPDISLRKIAPEFFTEEHEATIRDWVSKQSNYNFSQDLILAGTNDEVIDHTSVTDPILSRGKGQIYWIKEEKHKMCGTSYQFLFMKGVTDYETNYKSS